jgi:hypothetical protein
VDFFIVYLLARPAVFVRREGGINLEPQLALDAEKCFG